MPVQLRTYAPDDFEVLYEIDQVCYPRGIAYSRRTLRWFLKQAESDVLVAEIESKIAGFIIAMVYRGEDKHLYGHIITLDVLAQFRRQHIGSALLRESEKRMAARGVRTVELETARDNAAGIAFWQARGYRTRGVLRGYYLGRHDAYWMTKRL